MKMFLHVTYVLCSHTATFEKHENTLENICGLFFQVFLSLSHGKISHRR